MIPQRNAYLTAVAGSSSADTWEGETAGAAKWTGSAPAYLQERRDRAFGPEAGGSDRQLLRSLVISRRDVGVEIAQGDVVTFTFNGQSETGTVRLVERRELPGMPPYVETTRLTFETV